MKPVKVEAPKCGEVRIVGGIEHRCTLQPEHSGVMHMAPGDSGDSAVPGQGPYMVTWPSRGFGRGR